MTKEKMAIPLYNIKFIMFISASFITIFSSIAIYFCLPLLISHVIRTQLSLSPSSGSFQDWRLNSVVDRIYLYNITNLSDLLMINNTKQHSLRPIPKLKEIGPFTFRQIREKINIKFDPLNETVIFDQKKNWTFIPELSVVNTIENLNSTWINHVNIPLSGSSLAAEYAEFIDPIVAEFDLKLFLNHSANALLFEGYFDILMEQAKSSGQIDIDRFGWMYNQNNSLTKNIRVFTGPSNATINKIGAVDQLNYLKRFEIWHNNNTEPKDTKNVQCNEFRMSSIGEFFPPPEYSIISYNHNNQLKQQPETADKSASFTEQNDSKYSGKITKPLNENKSNIETDNDEQKTEKSITLFMPDLCRTFKLVYNSSYNYKDLKVDRYIANQFTYDYTSEIDRINNDKSSDQRKNFIGKNSNRCYCIYNENTKLTSCPPNGMMDIFTCKKGSPLTISFPHFLYSDKDKTLLPYLKLFNDEIVPNEAEHQFYIDLESTLSIPIKVQIVIQFNVHFRVEGNLKFTHDYSFLVDNPAAQNISGASELTDFYLPQMWFKSTAEIDDKNLENLKFIQNHLKFVTPITTVIMCALGSILLIMSAKLAYDLTYGPKPRKSISRDQESCSSMNRNELGTYSEEKQKYYTMQLLGSGEKSSSNNKSNSCNHDTNNRLNKPTTSKVDDLSESLPLNEQ